MRKNLTFLLGTVTGICLTVLVSGPQGAHLVAAANAARSDAYTQLNLLGDVFERVRAAYVEKPDDTKLIEGAISGMIGSLDPHSRYMNAKSWSDMRESTTGEFGGLGIEVTMEDGLVKVVAPIDDTPAAKAGLMTGDLITQIDDEAIQGLTLEQAVRKMKGPAKSKIRLKIIRKGSEKPVDIALGARSHPGTAGPLSHRRRRYRLHQDHLVQRTDHGWPAQGGWRDHPRKFLRKRSLATSSISATIRADCSIRRSLWPARSWPAAKSSRPAAVRRRKPSASSPAAAT